MSTVSLNDDNRWLERINNFKREVERLLDNLSKLERDEATVKDKIIALQDNSKTIRRKIFDEAFELIDNVYLKNSRDIKRCEEEIISLQSSIETLQKTRSEIEDYSQDEVLLNLKSSLKEYQKKSMECIDKEAEIKGQLSRLMEQQQRFTEFKSFIANSKIEALSMITNEFLESIGSDIRISFSGYTKLKSGKIREKISVSLLRDGIDLGSFGKFSEGEKVRVNLATILAMQKLVNSNCEDDKGLDLLVLDEILAAVDEEGHAMMFESLNKLKTTTLIVSHGNISEAYPHVLIVRKEANESKIM